MSDKEKQMRLEILDGLLEEGHIGLKYYNLRVKEIGKGVEWGR